MNIILNIDINNVFQQHAFINTCMRIVASICVSITPNTSRNFIYSALPAKKKKKKTLCRCCCCQENSLNPRSTAESSRGDVDLTVLVFYGEN